MITPGALIKIESLRKALPNAEQRVADYILRHPEKAPYLSVAELAKAANVSVASVSRLAKKAGYDSFRTFKIDIAQENAANVHDIYQAIGPDDSDEDIIKKVFAGNIRSLDDTLKLLNADHLIRAARMINQADRLVVLGIGSSANIARDAALRFAHLGFHAHAYVDAYQMLVQILHIGPNDLVVGLSHSGRSRITTEGLRLARTNGAATIGISNYPRSRFADASDIFLCTAFAERRVRAAALSSRLSQICLIDALYVLVARHIQPQRDIKQLDETTEHILRWPENR